MVERFVRDEEAVGSNPVMRGLRGCLFLIFACMLCSKQGFFAHISANMGVKMGVKMD